MSIGAAATPTIVAATVPLEQAVSARATSGIYSATFNRSTAAQRATVTPQWAI